jgi:hypothetical protein
MKMLITIFCFLIAAQGFAQTLPASGSSGTTIGSHNTDDPNPIPTPRPGGDRPHWDPTPQPNPTPIPRPTPTPSPAPQNGYVIHTGDHVLFRDLEYIVVGTSSQSSSILLRSPFNPRNEFPVPANSVAKMDGCVRSYHGPVCAGDMTVGMNNVYYSVIGIFWDGTVVVETTDSTHTVYGNIDPNSLTVVR